MVILWAACFLVFVGSMRLRELKCQPKMDTMLHAIYHGVHDVVVDDPICPSRLEVRIGLKNGPVSSGHLHVYWQSHI